LFAVLFNWLAIELSNHLWPILLSLSSVDVNVDVMHATIDFARS